MKVIAVTQARVGSTRLPNKILKKINGVSLLKTHLERINRAEQVDEVFVATTNENGVEDVIEIAESCGVKSYRGSTEDVLDRFYQTVKDYKADFVVRLTSDCPLIDSELIDKVIKKAVELNVDYCSNTLKETFPDGQDVEVFKFKALEKAWNDAVLKSDREHVTPYIWRNSTEKGGGIFSSFSFENDENFGFLRMTVDEQVDFEVLEWLISEKGIDLGWKGYVDFMLSNRDKLKNIDITRNEGYLKSLKLE